MKRRTASALRPGFVPVEIRWSDRAPDGAMGVSPGKGRCPMGFPAAAAKGRSAAWDRSAFGCLDGGLGRGFGNPDAPFPGGEDGFCHFLSHGSSIRGVVGLTDKNARRYLRRQLGRDPMTVAAPPALSREMEENAPGSFPERNTRRSLQEEDDAG